LSAAWRPCSSWLKALCVSAGRIDMVFVSSNEVGGFRRRRESAALIGSRVYRDEAVPGAEEQFYASVTLCF
jgi:hypothetical protein